MANKTIIKSASAVANTTLYTHTDSTPLLITGSTFKVSIPSGADYPSSYITYCNLYLAKKQTDGTYISIRPDYTMIAGKVLLGGGGKSSPSLGTVIGYNPYLIVDFNSNAPAYSLLIPNSYAAAWSGGSVNSYEIKQARLVISTGDYIYCAITGNDTSGRVVYTAIISTTTTAETRNYKGTLFKGYWVAGGNYKKNDTVISNNHLYMAIQANNASTITTANWVLIKNNAANINALIISDLTTVSGKISPIFAENLSVSSTLSNKVFVNAKISGSLGLTSTSESLALPTISSNTTLALTNNAQTLNNKAIWYSTFGSTSSNSSIFNFSDQNITANNGFNYTKLDCYVLFKPVTKTLTSGTNNILLNSTGGINFVCQTTTTAADSFSIVLPSASSYSGYTISFIIKMLAANQTVSFSTVKTSRSFTASTTANLTDRYLLVCDGTNWYCIQVNKGIS
jgi:hypothetical protein